MAVGGSGKGIQIVVGTDYNDRDLKRAQRDLDRLKAQATATMTPMQKLGGTIKGALGPALIGASAAAGAFAIKLGIESVQAAIADEAAADKLATTLRNLGLAHDTDRIEDYIFELQRSSGVVDDEMRPAFERLVRSTENVDEAQRALAIALDISVSKGKPLQSVVDAIGKAYDGNTLSLGRLGLGLDSTILKTRDMGLITTELSRLFRGQAAAAANTWEGRLQRINVAVDELKESFGAGILDGFGNGKQTTDDLIDAIYELGPAVEKLGTSFGELGKTIAENRGLIDLFTMRVQSELAQASFAIDLVGYAWKSLVGIVTGSWPTDETERAGKSASQMAYEFGRSGKAAGIMAELVKTEAAPAVYQLGDEAAVSTDAMALLRAEIRRTTTHLGFLTTAFDDANAAMDRRESMRNYEAALKEFIADPSAETRDAAVTAAMDVADSFDDPKQQARFMAGAYDSIVTAAKDAGVKVPPDLAKIGTAANNALDPVASLKREMELIPPEITTKIRVETTYYGTPPPGGYPNATNGSAYGGFVGGHGGTRADDVPAMLSSGEFVIQAPAVSRFGRGFFAALNQGVNPLDGMTPSVATRGGGLTINGGINVTSVAGEGADESLPRALRRMAFLAGMNG